MAIIVQDYGTVGGGYKPVIYGSVMKSQSGSRTFTLNDAYDFVLTVPPNTAWDTDTVYSDAIPCILRGESYTYIKSGTTYTTSLSSDGTQITIDMSSTGGTYITCYGKLE